MLLGHWYLVQPGLSRAPLNQLVRSVGYVWPAELVGDVVANGHGVGVAGHGRRRRQRSASAGSGWPVPSRPSRWSSSPGRRCEKSSTPRSWPRPACLYLAILTAFGMDLVARAILA